jgi:hypothetical protein
MLRVALEHLAAPNGEGKWKKAKGKKENGQSRWSCHLFPRGRGSIRG